MSKFIDILSSIFGNKASRDMKAIQPLVDEVKKIYPEIQALDHDGRVAGKPAARLHLCKEQELFHD